MYACILLNQDDAEFLKTEFQNVIGTKFFNYRMETPHYKLPHHMTINMGEFDESLNPIYHVGKPVDMYIDGFAYDNDLGVAAARVFMTDPNIVTINKQPHITMALQKQGKPFFSNQLNWDNVIKISRSIVVSGIVTTLR